MQTAFNQIHKALHFQNIPIENSIKVVCFRCFSPGKCDCPNGNALRQASRKLWAITKDIPMIDGDLKNRCADFALHEAGIHEKNVEAMTLSEMVEQGISPKAYINKCGKRAFYEWGLQKTNEAYLSAYFIICAGSKIVQKNTKCGLENPQVIVEDHMNVATMTKDGEVYHMEMTVQPTEILVNQ
ncbi:hypothetical protein B9Z55_026348 [Caenorhabditis nigoni]|uniref:Uncharacterized protein n=1 Tax=Caenorhabditis nigoni TaxID=1611254 RepID=A0A2G5T2P7_9PELO|nr:hypothetical protein B9Z55_026348 [Caenorhabditis nigoni]